MAHQSELIATNIEAYLKEHEHKEMVRFITCGSVDDGKSTLIGRLLFDSKMIFEDQLAAIAQDSKRYGTTGENIDLALLVDGLASEREQGITIDVAYRYFSTQKRKFIIADTPGHEQYTRNMVTGASTADVAIILIDARQGVLTQTKRHSYIVGLLGIKHVIVAINKMDLVDYSKDIFEQIKADYEQIIPSLPRGEEIDFHFLPISALKGENILVNSSQTPWFEDLPLMPLLDNLPIQRSVYGPFRFPVQYVNRPHLDFRGYCGTIVSGDIRIGDRITALPSRKSSTIKSIILPYASNKASKTSQKSIESSQSAFSPMAITLCLEDEIDISRGDMIVKSDEIPDVSSTLSVMLVWMSEEPLSLQTSYIIKRATTLLNGTIEEISYKKEINTFEQVDADKLELNDIAQCTLVLDRPLAIVPYNENRQIGSFIMIDRYNNNTVAAGMIIEGTKTEYIHSSKKAYSEAENALNAYIRTYFPEWGCKRV